MSQETVTNRNSLPWSLLMTNSHRIHGDGTFLLSANQTLIPLYYSAYYCQWNELPITYISDSLQNNKRANTQNLSISFEAHFSQKGIPFLSLTSHLYKVILHILQSIFRPDNGTVIFCKQLFYAKLSLYKHCIVAEYYLKVHLILTQ